MLDESVKDCSLLKVTARNKNRLTRHFRVIIEGGPKFTIEQSNDESGSKITPTQVLSSSKSIQSVQYAFCNDTQKNCKLPFSNGYAHHCVPKPTKSNQPNHLTISTLDDKSSSYFLTRERDSKPVGIFTEDQFFDTSICCDKLHFLSKLRLSPSPSPTCLDLENEVSLFSDPHKITHACGASVLLKEINVTEFRTKRMNYRARGNISSKYKLK